MDGTLTSVARRPPYGVTRIRLGGSPYGVLWQGRNTVTRRLGPRTPIPNVLTAGAPSARIVR